METGMEANCLADMNMELIDLLEMDMELNCLMEKKMEFSAPPVSEKLMMTCANFHSRTRGEL